MTHESWPGTAPWFAVERGAMGYPPQLEATPDPPRRLEGYGDPSALEPGLAVIGARRATPYGLSAARRFAGWAASAGYVIVSGAAVGCDQAAHLAALEAAGRTVAVLGCGADVAYPRGSEALLARIALRGAVVSEYPTGFPPAKWTFRARNRIIAGLSGVLLVVEAGLGSGTFVTADAALAAGRDVLVVPGSIFAPECAGSNRLIRQGATPVTDVSELRDALADALGEPRHRPASDPMLIEGDDPVLCALRTNPERPDDLSRELGLDVVTIARRIGGLEAAGLVRKYPDGRYGAARS